VTAAVVTVRFTGDDATWILANKDKLHTLAQEVADASHVTITDVSFETTTSTESGVKTVTVKFTITPQDGGVTPDQAVAAFLAEYQADASTLRGGEVSGRLDYSYTPTSEAVTLTQCPNGTYAQTCSGAAHLTVSLALVLLGLFVNKML